MLKKVARVGKRRDFLVLNFGLHFSETYREELQGLVNEASTLPPVSLHLSSMYQRKWSTTREALLQGAAVLYIPVQGEKAQIAKEKLYCTCTHAHQGLSRCLNRAASLQECSEQNKTQSGIPAVLSSC